ncbi:hypothetical protein GQ607_008326 [Colletotrichum asianum]|uniref:Uncharacterized protein n=1 Tax=Colletotrichum asianum TaxID=702518 RepID=A0A8H3WGV9_9PEZI|nr:hypothetical protein GQ607_008326 [Colletotrichum asianum]
MQFSTLLVVLFAGITVATPAVVERQQNTVDEGERLKNPFADDEEDDDADSVDDDNDGHHGSGAAGAVTDAWAASVRESRGIIFASCHHRPRSQLAQLSVDKLDDKASMSDFLDAACEADRNITTSQVLELHS